ncbi:unnamed protein product [Nezara viridula]|uniref:Uncharacterized protein n=1 Tax=Nezara viridula TaxID=85310 RepID=A0A9P0HJD6_NEZVI|nr:unnamed protein product [Nezara viridula]
MNGSSTSISREDSGDGLVSITSENLEQLDLVDEKTALMEDMMNQGEKTTESYVHFGEPKCESDTEPRPSTSLKAGGVHHGIRAEEPFGAHRNVHYPKFRYASSGATDDGDLLKRDDGNKGKTEAHYVAEKGDLIRLSELHNYSMNVRDDKGWAPAMYATSNGQLEALQLLQKNGANLRVFDTQGRSLLHIAAAFGHEHVICWLLEEGFDIRATDFYDMTPLHLAAAHNQVGAARLLVLNGADISLEDDRNRTPLKIAQIAGHPEIIDLLREIKASHI